MQDITGTFKTSKFFFGNFRTDMASIINGRHVIVITDEHVYKNCLEQIGLEEAIVIPAGEESKALKTIEYLTEQLLAKKAHRRSLLIGIGGGVVTDITGYIATIYMRGVPFGFIPTSLLAMVDATIGGKNGINYGLHKNMLGTFSQPEFISIDPTYLHTLPDEEWSNGFAEIVKYACLFNAQLLDEMLSKDLAYYKNNEGALMQMIYECAAWKEKTVQQDEKESGQRKLLNFGHTCGHAIETLYNIPHGQAVSLGIIIACTLSEQLNGLPETATEKVKKALANFSLPTHRTINIDKVLQLVEMDKKRANDKIDFITLKSIGNPDISRISLSDVRRALETFYSASSN